MFARLRFIRDGLREARYAMWGKETRRNAFDDRTCMLLILLLGLERESRR
jgi:hypothetical protein